VRIGPRENFFRAIIYACKRALIHRHIDVYIYERHKLIKRERERERESTRAMTTSLAPSHASTTHSLALRFIIRYASIAKFLPLRKFVGALVALINFPLWQVLLIIHDLWPLSLNSRPRFKVLLTSFDI
jgi:hypothetical protein